MDDDQLKCYEDLDLKKIQYSAEPENYKPEGPSPVTKVFQSDASDGIEEYLAWRRYYGKTDESEEEENEIPTIQFTDDINSISELEIGIDDCQAHVPPQTRLPKKMTESGNSETFAS